MPLAAAPGLLELAKQAALKTQSYYFSEQHGEGYWWYELESNVTITAEYLMLLKFLGMEDPARDKRISNYILKKQRPDGTWAIHWGAVGDLSTTVEAYFALKLAGHSAEEPAMRRARRFILANGGAGASRVFTKIFLAIFGQLEWDVLPSMPVEFMFLPPRGPISIYDLSSWARATIVPLAVLLELKPVRRPVPEEAGIRELFQCRGRRKPVRTELSTAVVKKCFFMLDRFLKVMEKFPLRPFKARALKLAEDWILAHQEQSGDWGGIQPAMLNSILALRALGHGVSSGPVLKGLEALERFTITTGEELVLQSCISPVWDTALSAIALQYSGVPKGHYGLLKSCSWLASKQILTKGDWSVKRPGLRPGGWAFEFDNSHYPDVDDTAVVLMFLLGYREDEFIKEKVKMGIEWVLGMQGRDGGWGAFDADNNMEVLNRIPFADLEAMIDPSSPDITGRVLEMLGMSGSGSGDPRVRRAIAYLKKNQEEDGSFWARWGVNYIYGTWSVLMGLRAIGEDMSMPWVRKAVQWLRESQNLDGGWGECCESYADCRLRGTGPSTPSQTAWALLGLMAAGESRSEEVAWGIQHLLERQKEDGTWDEDEFTGTGFPRYFMINYHNYRNCFPLMALGKFIGSSNGGGF